MNGPEEMNEFEQRLAQAMKHLDAPEGFADRVMARAASVADAPRSGLRHADHGTGKVLVMLRRQWISPQTRTWVSGALAASLVAGVFMASQVHERREKARVLATQQFEESQRITDQAMEKARAQLKRAGIDLDQ
ncbi:MAG: hypothetical protein V4555_21325 [Acidobacteriota bacterium]